MLSHSVRTPVWVAAFALLVSLVSTAGAQAAVTQKQAERKAIAALKLTAKGDDPVVLFRERTIVKRGTAITQAGARPAGKAAATARDRALKAAGVKIITAPVVARTGSDAAWFFYEDQAPSQAYEHAGRVVLVARSTGRVTISRSLNWPPLIGGKLPRALANYDAYRDPKYRAFERSWVVDTPATGARAAAPKNETNPSLPSTLAQTPAAKEAIREAARQLAAERSCALRFSDSLGDFFDAGPVDNTRAALGLLFRELSDLDPGFFTDRYTYRVSPTGPGLTPSSFVTDTIKAKGCKDVLLYFAGAGTTVGGEPAINIGIKTRKGGRLETQTVTPSDLKAVIARHPEVTFKIEVDAPRSGAFIDAVGTSPNLIFLASSATGNQGSFTALDEVVDPSGRPSQNTYNASGLLEFTNRQLKGLGCFLSSPVEVAAATRAKAQGRSRSFFAWMLARSLSVCGAGYLPTSVQNTSVPKLIITFPAPKDSDLNQAPTAAGGALSTDEDTPLPLTLTGQDIDGDPLTFQVVTGPSHGTLTGGTAASRTYTPAKDFSGADTFTFTVSDGKETSAPVTVTITVRPVNDAPVLTLGGGTTSFSEAGAAVVVDGGLTVADVDSARLTGATATLDAVRAGDTLAFTAGSGITGSFSAATGVLTLSGDATVAEYQAVLRTVTFRNPNANLSAATRQVVFGASDGQAAGASAARPITVTVVNDAPSLTGGGSTAAYTEDDTSGVLVGPNLSVDDVDSLALQSARVRITGGLVSAEDELVFPAQNGIIGSYTAATGVLTLTGAATPANYQAALRSVRYRNGNTASPATPDRTISIDVNDGDLSSSTVTTTVTVARVNDAPVLTTGAGTTTFAEDGGAVVVAPTATADDVDDTNLTGATVRLTTGFDAAQDTLTFTNTAAITGAYDSATGVLTLTGAATVADYQAALRTITYANSSQEPSGTSRTVSFTATDGTATSAAVTRSIAIVSVNDAPVLGSGGNTVTFNEDDTTGVIVNSGITVSDVDNATLASATVQITANLDASEDELVFATQNGITGSYTASTGLLTLTGTATLAQYQTALRSIRYRNNDAADPSSAQRVVSFTVNDGAASSNASNTIVSNVDVVPSNDAPVLAAGAGATANFTEGGTGVAIDTGITATDGDSANLASATVSITGGLITAEDRLDFTDTATITGTYTQASGTLTLTGTDTVANYQAALRSVLYRNANGDDPSGASRTLGFQVSDGALVSNTVSRTVTVTPVNDAPVLTAGAGTAAFVEDAGAVAVAPAATLVDVDDLNFSGATAQITGNYSSGNDVLAFTDTATITGTWNATSGTLTLSGSDTRANYQAAIRAITFSNSSDTPSTATRTVTFSIADAAAAPSSSTRDVTVTPANDRPVVTTGGGSPLWIEGGGAITVDPAVTVSDPDGDQITGATIGIGTGFVSAQDRLVYTTTHAITGIYDIPSGVLTLTGTGSAADYADALRAVQYDNTSSSPSTTNRAVNFVVNDGTINSLAASKAVQIQSNNTAPVLGGGSNTLAYTEDDAATIVNANVTASDGDDTDLESATISITNNYDSTEDELTFSNTAAITGSWNGATGVLTLTGTDTVANYQSALRAVRYVNNDQASPNASSRTVSFKVNDGEVDSNAATTTVTIAQNPDAPTLTAGTGNTNTFTEGGSDVVVDDAIVAADVDSANLTGATVSITTGFSQAQGDTLAFSPGNGITGSYAGATGVLTLSGSSSVANYQAALRTVTFSNTSQAPTSPRTVSFTATDGAATSSAVTHQVLLAGVNDAPTLSGGGTLAYTENDAATAISTALVVTDADSTTITGARVEVTANYGSGQDVLSFVNTANITGSWNAGTGVLTLSGSDTVANYQAALRAVRYANTSNDPSTAARTITYTASDNGTPSLSGSTTATVNVTAVNDAPTVTGEADSSVGNTRVAYGSSASGIGADRAGIRRVVSGNVLTNDTDVDGPGPLTVDTALSPTTTSQGGAVTWTADGSFTYDPPLGFTGVDTLTYTATDGGTPAATTNGTVSISVSGRVWYVDNTFAAGGDGRSSQPFDTLAEADAAANATNDRIYVHEGSGTSTGLTGGVTLLAGQRLTGEAKDLVVGSDTLFDSVPADRPIISGSVQVDDGNTVEGLTIESQSATAPAIDGGTGDVAGTLDDLELTSAAAGSGLKLANTTGTWNVANTTITSAGASSYGLSLTDAGTVNLANTGTITVANSNGSSGIDVSGTTALSGTIDGVTTTGSGTGISITSNTGSLALNGLSLGATSTGLRLNSTNGITIASGSVSAGGTAVDVNTDANTTVTTPPSIALTTASSTGGSYGFRVDDLGSGTVSAAGGSLSGQTTSGVSVVGGTGNVTYAGSIGNGTGASAQVSGRSNGTTTLSGSITDTGDAGGGISVTGNTGGTVNVSGPAKTLATTTSTGVDFSGGGTLNLTGGSLAITTTSGAGLNATGTTGTLSVQGSGNTISSGTGTALSVNGPDFTTDNATFQSIAASGGTNGILLADTGTNGGLRVTGTGGAGTGGTIANQTGAGVSLSNTRDVQLASVNVQNGGDDGVRGSGVNGFQLTGSSAVTGNGNAVTERGLDFTELSGVVTLTNLTATGNAEDNVAIVNDAATITNLQVSGGTYGSTSTTIGNDGFLLTNTGSGGTTGTISGATFTNNRGDHIQISTDNSTTSVQNLTIQSNALRGTGNQGGNTMVGGGISIGAGGAANQTVTLDNNDIERPYSSAISLNLAGLTNTATAKWTVTNNTIGTNNESLSGSAANSSVYYNVNGNGTATSLIEGNDFRGSAFTAIDIVNNDGDATVNATVRNNIIAEPRVPTPGQPSTFTYTYGLRFVLGSDSTDNGDGCLDLGSATAGLRNQLFGTGQDGLEDLSVTANGDDNDLQLVGYAGTPHDNAAVRTYLQGRNDKGGTPTVNVDQFDTTNSSWLPGPAACPLP